eukprot:SAG31_NODE_3962_length_3717_cov_1.953013_1_plen_58_part_10
MWTHGQEVVTNSGANWLDFTNTLWLPIQQSYFLASHKRRLKSDLRQLGTRFAPLVRRI